MSAAGFEPAIPASERTQTHTLDRVALGLALYDYRMEYLGGGGLPPALPRTSIQGFHKHINCVCQWHARVMKFAWLLTMQVGGKTRHSEAKDKTLSY